MTGFWKLCFAILFLGVFSSFLAVFQLADDKLHLVVCDVGQGDGILVYRKQVQVLVDAGPDQKIMSCLGSHMPFWDRSIEAVMLTNPDLDHYGGLIDIVRSYKVGKIIIPDVGKEDSSFEGLENEVEMRKIGVIRVIGGEKIKVANLSFDILWPKGEDVELLSLQDDKFSKVLGAHIAKSSPNKYSIVSLFKYGEFEALLTGDVEPPASDEVGEGVREIRDIRGVGEIEVLKVPHHGSKNGLTEGLLEVARPGLAIISAGRNNRFGHPHQETLGLLGRFGVKTLGTYEKGEIEVVTDGRSWQAK